MKVIKLSECEMGDYYFFVYNGIVHYGYASQKYNDFGIKPTIFCSEGINICEIDSCSLIYQL